MENEPPWSSGYVLQLYSGGACEQKALALGDFAFSNLPQTTLEYSGGGGVEQYCSGGETWYRQCSNYCVPVTTYSPCYGREFVCITVGAAAAAAAAAACVGLSGPASAACTFAAGALMYKVCEWKLVPTGGQCPHTDNCGRLEERCELRRCGD